MNAYFVRPRRLAALVGAVLAALPAASAPARARAPLATRLSRALAVPHVSRARTAAIAVDLRTGAVAYRERPTLPLAPASTEKLGVSYTLLTVLGPHYRIQTRVLAEGSRDGATWRGRLVVKGYGDPTLSSSDLRALARTVRARGIRRVTGGIVGDESFFDARRTAPGWRASYYVNECAPLSALTVDEAWYRGRISRQPALAAAASFRSALRRTGVAVVGGATVGAAGPDATALAGTSSAPLADILRLVDQDSDNFTAETLLKHVAAVEQGVGTTAGGARIVRATLQEAGIPLTGVRIVDGSGLSLLDRATAAELVGILGAARADSYLQASFVRSLAVAGRTGTLRTRMRGQPVVGKTGTTSRASALAGFAGDRYAFAVVQNGSPVSWWWARVAQDRFATILAHER